MTADATLYYDGPCGRCYWGNTDRACSCSTRCVSAVCLPAYCDGPADRLTPDEGTDPTLLWLLRRAGDEWGPMGVALTAVSLTDERALLARLDAATPTPDPEAGVVHCGLRDRWSNQTCTRPAGHTDPHQAAGIPIEPATGTCCENGSFGQAHDCMKQPADPAAESGIDTAAVRRSHADQCGCSGMRMVIRELCDALDQQQKETARLQQELVEWKAAHARALRDREAVEREMDARWVERNGRILTLSDQRDAARDLAAALEAELARVRAAVNVGATPALIAEILDEATDG